MESVNKFFSKHRSSLERVAFVDIRPETIKTFNFYLQNQSSKNNFTALEKEVFAAFKGGNLVSAKHPPPRPPPPGAEASSTSFKASTASESDVESRKDTKPAEATDSGSLDKDENGECSICQDVLDKPKKLSCGHSFCTECIDTAFEYKPVCPDCGATHGVIVGDQPAGEMRVYNDPTPLPGYDRCATIVIDYNFPNGVQSVSFYTHYSCKKRHEEKKKVSYSVRLLLLA